MSQPTDRKLDIQFNRGLRQDLEENLLPPGALTFAKNVEFDKSSRLQKRDGFTAVGTSKLSKSNSFVGPVRGIAQGANGERLLFTDENTFLHFSDSNMMAEAGFYGQHSVLRATLQDKFTVGADQAGLYAWCDSACVGNWIIIAYAQRRALDPTKYDMLIDVIDKTTKAKALTTNFLNPVGLADVMSSVQGRLVVVGSKVFLIAADTAGNINFSSIDLSGTTIPNPIAPASLVTDAFSTHPFFDADATTGGFVLAYRSNAHSMKARIFDSSGTSIFGPVTKLGGPAGLSSWHPSAIGVLGARSASEQIFILGWDKEYLPGPIAASQMEILITDYQLTTVQSTFESNFLGVDNDVQQVSVGRYSTTTAMVMVSTCGTHLSLDLTNYNHGPRGPISMGKLLGSTGVYTNITPAFANYCLASKMLQDANGNLYAWARFNVDDQAQSHYLLLDFCGNGDQALQRPTPCLHVANGLVPTFPVEAKTSGLYAALVSPGLPSFTSLGNGEWLFAGVVNLGGSLLAGQQIGCFVGDFLKPNRFASVVAARTLLVAGGTPLSYDGQRLVELSFYSYPEATLPDAHAAGAFTAGDYNYRFVYEWTDAAGNRHQSPATPAITVTLAGGEGALTLECSTIHATRKQVLLNTLAGSNFLDVQSPVRIVAYRDTRTRPLTFFRLPTEMVNKISKDLAGNITICQNTVTMEDTYSTDSVIETNEILYTTDGGRGELSSNAPPPSLLMAVHAGRLWGIDAENPERIWCTKTFEEGEAPSYNPGLQVLILGCGRVHGIGAQDDKLYGLSTVGTYVATYGPGPDNTGQGAFPDPVLITTSATCDDHRGVITSTDGIYFTGPDHGGTGIYLLRRGDAAPISIGLRARDELATFPEIRGVIERIDKARVEFMLVNDNADPSKGVILNYHYEILDEAQIGQWTTSGLYDDRPLECIGLWDGLTVIGTTALYSSQPIGIQSGLTTVGGNPMPGTDWGAPFEYDVITGDIRPFGIGGWGDIHSLTLVGTGRTRAGFLQISSSFDSRVNWAETLSTNTPEVSAAPILRRWEMATKKLPNGSAAYRFNEHLSSEDGTVYTDGPILHGFSLEIVPLTGNVRLADSKRDNETLLVVPVGVSSVVQTGPGAAAVVAGTPIDFGSGLITVTTSGGVGAGKFDWSFLGQSATNVTLAAGAMTLGSTGVTVTFAAGSITLATTYVWDAV